MTVECAPLSIEDVLRDVVRALTPAVAAKAIGKSVGYLDQLANPNNLKARLAVEDAVKLDLAHAAAFGGTMPIYEQYGRIVAAALTDIGECRAELLASIAESVKETAELHAAALELFKPSASKQDRLRALREWVGASKAVDRIGAKIRRMCGSGSARSP